MLVPVETEITDRMSFPVHELVARRWSPKAFSARPVEPEKLRSLFEAARLAPSSYNEQPWRFIVATQGQGAEFERILSTLMEGNRQWAQHAPVLILSVATLIGERTGKPNRHAWHDLGQAIAYLTLQATELGLYVHQMGGFDVELARQRLQIPEGYEPVAVIALGYLDEAQGTSMPPRNRKAVEDLVFSGRWGQATEGF
ncbi:MAG: nitroreductase family protein [Acidobacteriia bacterium]|nr:nitroreductase family protein [Terriglobia bacterium]